LLRLLKNELNPAEEEKKQANEEELLDEIDEAASEEKKRLTNQVNDMCRFVSQEWSPDQEEDRNLPHYHRSVYVRSVVLNNRFYIFQNLAASNQRAIKVIDPSLNRLF